MLVNLDGSLCLLTLVISITYTVGGDTEFSDYLDSLWMTQLKCVYGGENFIVLEAKNSSSKST